MNTKAIVFHPTVAAPGPCPGLANSLTFTKSLNLAHRPGGVRLWRRAPLSGRLERRWMGKEAAADEGASRRPPLACAS
jgi:hypothetical protein